MNKKIIPILTVIFLVVSISAGIITLTNLKPVEIPAKDNSIITRAFEGNITCDCNGKKDINCGYISESILQQDDLNSAVSWSEVCEGTKAINLKLNGKLIKNNSLGDISTDEDWLNERECIKEGGEIIKGICNERVINQSIIGGGE